MRNISFDNPYWLLLLIPLLIGILVPYFIAIRKDNKSGSTVASLIMHIAVLSLIALSVAGMVISRVVTKTEVIVVADLSHSANAEVENIDRYINEITEALPDNSKVGVVCFGKNYILHTPLGEAFTTVKGAAVDESATDIASAVEYAGTLFDEGVLKKVVLITDGSETVSEDVSAMVAAVEKLVADDISVDAIYLDSNIREGVNEVQLTGVDYTEATYLNHETTADVLIQSNTEVNAMVSLYRNGEKLTDRAVILTAGYNIVNFDLPTDTAASFHYEVRVSAEGDVSANNNSYAFSQTVSGDIQVLMVTSERSDIEAAENLYGENATIDVIYLPTDHRDFEAALEAYKDHARVHLSEDVKNIPCSVEELVLYDEFLLSSVDIRNINNVSAFIESLEIVVSRFGKSLVTAGDTKIQNKTDVTLESLENMLPVKFGNSAQDSKLFAIVIDSSRSMFQASRFAVAKQAAIHMLNMLSDTDDVIVVTFAGDISIIQPTTKASNRQAIAKKINALQPQQGTSIGGGLAAAVGMMLQHEHDVKQVVLISDGMNYSAEIVKIEGKEMNAVDVAQYMAGKDITVSAMNPYNQEEVGIHTLENIAEAGNGEYYYLKDENSLSELVFSDMADDLTESVVNKESLVQIAIPKDDVMAGVPYLPSVLGYVHSRPKSSAKTVLTVEYTRASGTTVQVPLYSYWKYGNGKVACYTSTLSGAWAENWQDNAGQRFLKNVTDVSVPQVKTDDPYSMNIRYDGIYSNVEIIPAVLDPYATVEVTILHPDGREVTERLIFDASGYSYRFPTDALGKYGITVVYTTKTGSFSSSSDFHISYSPEYNRFENFDASNLYAAIRHHGTVVEGGIPDLSGQNERLARYRLTFTIPFMIAAIVLYVVDIIVRKIKWVDIKSLFVRRKIGGK